MDAPPIIDVQLCQGPVTPRVWKPFPPGGAECRFLGCTRPESHPVHGQLKAIEYEAHESLARSTFDAIVAEAVQRFHPLALVIYHATGRVPLGEASVVIQVVSNHRAEAFEACRFLIDALKARTPIWKRAIWDHAATWPEGEPLHQHECELT